MRPGTNPIYDEIGGGYSVTRRSDPRIAAAIRAALGDARNVVNVGAGAGSYEPRGVSVLAVEPSLKMIRQRSPGSASLTLQATAEHLPLRDASVDAALAVLTLHHWCDPERGLAELRRVSKERVVLVTWDPAARGAFWLTAHYFPEIAELDVGRFPSLSEIDRILGPIDVRPLPIPHDCEDGFLGAFWRRPAAYLDAAIRQGMSGFAQLSASVVDSGLARLTADLESGRWHERFTGVICRETADLGYRVVIGDSRD